MTLNQQLWLEDGPLLLGILGCLSQAGAVSVREGTSQCKRMTPTKIDGREANMKRASNSLWPFCYRVLKGGGCPRGGGVPGEP